MAPPSLSLSLSSLAPSACTREPKRSSAQSSAAALAERLPVDSPRVATLPYPIYHIYHFWLSTSLARALAASLRHSSPTERAVEPLLLLLLLHLLQHCATFLLSPCRRHERFSDIFHFYDCVYYQRPRTFASIRIPYKWQGVARLWESRSSAKKEIKR